MKVEYLTAVAAARAGFVVGAAAAAPAAPGALALAVVGAVTAVDVDVDVDVDDAVLEKMRYRDVTKTERRL